MGGALGVVSGFEDDEVETYLLIELTQPAVQLATDEDDPVIIISASLLLYVL